MYTCTVLHVQYMYICSVASKEWAHVYFQYQLVTTAREYSYPQGNVVKGIFIFPGKVIFTVYFMHNGQINQLSCIRLLLWQRYAKPRLHPEEYRESNNVGSSGVLHEAFTYIFAIEEDERGLESDSIQVHNQLFLLGGSIAQQPQFTHQVSHRHKGLDTSACKPDS